MTPTTVEAYLEQLREAMRDDDTAVAQDALYDAEEYLRSELADHADRPAAEVLAEIVASYGAPAEVAEAYRQTEETVIKALQAPPRPPSRGILGAVFGVFVDPRAYTSILYMLIALATGILYFTTVVTGLSVSLGLAITLIGIPFFLLFLALVRVLSLVEGRVVEAMLGVRMPRRPRYDGKEDGILQRIANMLTDSRTWTTLLYMVLQLPLGIIYFTMMVVGFSVSLAALLAPLVYHSGMGEVGFVNNIHWYGSPVAFPAVWQVWLLAVLGLVLLLVTMHLARFIGRVHGGIAKYLLVRY